MSGNPIPQPPNENVLELNLTTETISFATPLGNVPNRGLGNQQDITLNGVPYVQVINDVTNGKFNLLVLWAHKVQATFLTCQLASLLKCTQ